MIRSSTFCAVVEDLAGGVRVAAVGRSAAGRAERRVGDHVDRAQDLEDVGELERQPVDLLGRVEVVGPVGHPAAEPRLHRRGDGVPRPEAALDQRLDLAVVGTAGVGGVEEAVAVEDVDLARPPSVWSSSYTRPRSIVYDATRLSTASRLVHVGAHTRRVVGERHLDAAADAHGSPRRLTGRPLAFFVIASCSSRGSVDAVDVDAAVHDDRGLP